jgi:UDP-glucose 4-epimerase
MNVLITGAAGYIGSMMTRSLSQMDSISKIIGIDLKSAPNLYRNHHKIRFIQADIADDAWIEKIADEKINAVIHCAYQIRQLYGRKGEVQRRWNVDGARKVFEFALGTPSVRRLIQLSTVSAYGAHATNSVGDRLTESEPLNEDEYLYGVQKREVESLLRNLYDRYHPSTQVIVLRLASVSGPYGRFGLNRYGLVSTVAGKFPFLVGGRADWGRQYLHEDDVVAVIGMLTPLPPARGLEVLNVSPDDYLSVWDLGRVFGKRVLLIPPLLLRPLFWLLWHGTRGTITTPPGAWKFLSYPIRVDSSRLAEVYGYTCRYSSLEALLAETGNYAKGSSGPQADQQRPVAVA